MRRKSHRNATKASPEKPTETSSRRSRRHSKRRRRSSSESSSEESDDVNRKTVAQQQQQPEESVVEEKEKPTLVVNEGDTEQPIWKVTPSTDSPSGEVQKIKLCLSLTRPVPSSPEKTERSSRRRRNKSGSNAEEDIASPEDKVSRKSRHRGSPGLNAEEQEEDTDEQEDKKGKGKSKTKHRSKSEKTPQIQEIQDQTQSEISENVQVTPQSPQAAIDFRVDNESVSTIEHETVTADETETHSIPQNTNTSEICDVTSGNATEYIPEKQEKNHELKHDTPPQSPLTDHNSDSTKHSDSFDSQGNFKGFSAPEQSVVTKAQIEQNTESVVEETVVVQDKVELEKIEESFEVNSYAQEIVIDQNAAEISEQTEIRKSSELQEVGQGEPAIETVNTVEEDFSSEKRESYAEVNEPEQVCEPEQVREQKQEENMIVDKHESTDSKREEEHTVEVADSKEDSSQLQTRHDSKSESSSSDEAEPANNDQVASPTRNKEVEEQVTESRASPIHNKDMIVDESNSKSMEETHRSDEDSRSVDAIILDNSCTPSKEDTSFNLSQSFSPDIRQIVEVNKELQHMKSEISEMFPTPQKTQRKYNWGNTFAGLELIKSTLTKIDVETIKELCPELRFLDESEVKIDVREIKDRRKSYSFDQKERRVDRKVSLEYKSDDPGQRRLETQSSINSSEVEETAEPEVDNSNIIAMNRKISIVDDTASKLKPPPSPAKNPVAEVLYITNLVRPFTLKQLKELLERTGKIKENGFWTDRIKSKCYVHYETTDEAEATRNALHGVHWPIGNGKKLIIDYATQEDLEKARNPTPPPIIPEPKIPEKEPQDDSEIPPKRNRIEEHEKAPKERERHRSEGHVREWDIGKENMHKMRSRSREREGRNERNDRRRHRRTPSPVDDFISRKQRKKEEDIPQKLMDDLFRKTKATPSIYWLPLTPEEIAMKQQQRLLRMAEHKRRMEESSRGRGDYGRGAAYRRRYE